MAKIDYTTMSTDSIRERMGKLNDKYKEVQKKVLPLLDMMERLSNEYNTAKEELVKRGQ